jgi:hypothetical protein
MQKLRQQRTARGRFATCNAGDYESPSNQIMCAKSHAARTFVSTFEDQLKRHSAVSLQLSQSNVRTLCEVLEMNQMVFSYV